MADYPSSSSSSEAPIPVHLCFFMLTLMMFMGFSWYINYEPVIESMFDQVKLYLIMSPLVILLAVHWLSNHETRFSHLIPFPERESLHRAGGTPWGIGFLLVLLLFMISHHSQFQERWFPLLSR